MKGWLFLLFAITSEVVATTSLKFFSEYRNWVSVVFVVLGYASSFSLLSKALKYVPLSIAYAIWAGLGTALVAMTGVWLFKEPFTQFHILGIGLIVAGVAVLNLLAPSH
ncbi:Ethidium bromide-methyl viologen resistance protein EmrE [Geitlerinema sp. FC II]|nr:multidrug efflux SMR transporter [Geitlerinema sp. CS-897]PPT07402.1 Ethidium bromide-methyl viologen resistance protein EmrE [Geitlerinema sp. FC II]